MEIQAWARLALIAGTVCALAGCPGPAESDASDDVGVDAGADAALDAGTDSAMDAATDTGVDAATDAALDGGGDAGTDAASIACTADVDCAPGYCVGAGGPAAYCATPCTVEADCAWGTSCGFLDLAGTLVNACILAGSGGRAAGAACNVHDDCDSTLCVDYLCRELCGTCSASATCAPLTADVAGTLLQVNVCQWYAPAPELELGPLATPVGGLTDVTFFVPQRVLSFVITGVDDDGLRVGFDYLEAPDGTVLLDMNDGVPDLNKVTHYPGSASVLVPDTDDPAALVQPGTYTLRMGTYDPVYSDPPTPVTGDLERVAVSFEWKGHEGGVIDLNFYFAPATLLSVADADSDPFMLALLDQMAMDMRDHAGIAMGEVSFVADIPDTYDIVDTGAAVRDLCIMYSNPGPRGTSFDVVMVDNITFTGGIAGGAPMAANIDSTTGSCIVMSTFGAGAAATGIGLWHEIGHALGLFHTTETFDATIHDVISDTPECLPGTLIGNCPDYTNVMFPAYPLLQILSLSLGQSDTIRRGPGLYEIERPASCPSAGETFDVTMHRFATGNTSTLPPFSPAGSCGGTGPARAHLYRLTTPGLAGLEIRVTGAGYAPLVHVRTDNCLDDTAEVACGSADADVEAIVTVANPAPGPYFIFVDGRDGGGGRFTLDVVEIP